MRVAQPPRHGYQRGTCCGKERDREASLWVGTNAGGVSRLHDMPFRTVSKREGLPVDSTRAVFESADGGMWIGTAAHGLIRTQDGVISRWTTQEGMPSDGIAMIALGCSLWVNARTDTTTQPAAADAPRLTPAVVE